MKKPYFAKWLPVEVEIKEGDYYISREKYGNKNSVAGGVMKADKTATVLWKFGGGAKEDCQLVKLFLCSHDIKVGDTFFANQAFRKCTELKDGLYPFRDEDGSWHFYNWFKVIGEISPDAYSFVKEGDEFNSDDLLATEAGGFSVRKKVESIRPQFIGKAEIQVKGPCGHFH